VLDVQHLTADIGCVWEFYPPATPVQKGGFSNYDPTTNTLRVGGYGDIPDNLGIATHYKYFRASPRLGLSSEGINRYPRGVRHQLYAFPGQ